MLNRILVCLVVLAFAFPCAAEDAKPDGRVKLEGHRGGVSALAFSPGGKTLAVADTVEGVVQLWALPAKK